MSKTRENPLRDVMSDETAEVTDRLLGGFLLQQIGVNDMAVVAAMVSSAAILVRAHCDRTGEDFDEMIGICHSIFVSASAVLRERSAKP